MTVRSLEDLLLVPPPPLVPIVGGGILMERSKIVLFGPPKLGKSILAQQMAFCIASGQSWLGFPTSQRRVLMVQSEIAPTIFYERVVKMLAYVPPIPPKTLYFDTDFALRLDRPQGFATLAKAVSKAQAQVVFLDPLYKMLPSMDDTTMLAFYDGIDRLIDDTGVSVVVVAHDRKPIATANGEILTLGGADLRGPRTLEGWFETIIQVSGKPTSDIRTLTFETRHAENLIPPVICSFNRSTLWMERMV